LYLCNLGIPDKFYRDCGIKYKSPYGHKYVIPIHSKDWNNDNTNTNIYNSNQTAASATTAIH